ncbi:hypothetical protein BASA50_005904 [Batrachochytrium salamandrivorans]|uniref:CBF1-interacting co-repressor CIR N-terminal domain-containing protein n=1 Tax=Batrachochytrium salamandrivorans TaxID=1357716 RepID=A0ABQ8FBK1_9FUNG|nr:hypothetical protein BASA60_009847 [Batrachochytrium salamandrivorans]KAH6573212.1 hypothetical protein BASA62_003074 [Batrachochytrium salamandrivorans]KAH6580786.1 hypothetical protein BASA61_009421 [Batrachochytrium salamandrivorans]KAH6595386.1 hypothetical protein BASA50_005904 [Batrachochytrium salamandrivorans]KAH9247374.1 hypothetical protein BASA81_015037 [Batrachochytrium salamandrivorans]
MGGGDLNLKKSWHPGTFRNQENVWKREQAAQEEKKKLDQLRKEKAEEREREELQALNNGRINKSATRLEWMYTSAPGSQPEEISQDKEAFLLGKRRADKLVDQGAKVSDMSTAATFTRTSSTLYGSTANTVRDLQAKIRDDPLLAIKRREQASVQAVLSNPIRLKMLTESQNKKDKKKKKDKKDKKERKSKKERRSKDSDDSGVDEGRSRRDDRHDSSGSDTKADLPSKHAHDHQRPRHSESYTRKTSLSDRSPHRRNDSRSPSRPNHSSHRDEHNGSHRQHGRDVDRESKGGRQSLDRDRHHSRHRSPPSISPPRYSRRDSRHDSRSPPPRRSYHRTTPLTQGDRSRHDSSIHSNRSAHVRREPQEKSESSTALAGLADSTHVAVDTGIAAPSTKPVSTPSQSGPQNSYATYQKMQEEVRQQRLAAMQGNAQRLEMERGERVASSRIMERAEVEAEQNARRKRTRDGSGATAESSFEADMHRKAYMSSGATAADMIRRNQGFSERPSSSLVE